MSYGLAMEIRARRAVVICVTLAVVLGSAEAGIAAPRTSAIHWVARHGRALPLNPLRLFRPSSRGKAITQVGVGGMFKVSGSPYRWQVGAGHVRGGTIVLVSGFRQATNGYQSHTWFFRLATSALRVGARLRKARLSTGSGLGPFGQIDLTFAGNQPARTHAYRCPKTHEVLQSTTVRRGTLTGTLSFTPNEGTLPDLAATSMKAQAGRFVSSGKRCPNGSPRPHGCFRGSTFRAQDPALGATVFAPLDADFVGFEQVERIAPALVDHSLTASAVHHPARKTPTGFLVRATDMSPLASGSLRFTDGPSSVHHGRHCIKTKIPEAWSAGTVTVNFDSGALALTGSQLKASLRVFAEPA